MGKRACACKQVKSKENAENAAARVLRTFAFDESAFDKSA